MPEEVSTTRSSSAPARRDIGDVTGRFTDDLNVADHGILYQLIVLEGSAAHALNVALNAVYRIEHVAKVVGHP
jgi:hypothetical protein